MITSISRMSRINREDNPFGVLEFLHWDHAWNKYKYSGSADWEKAIGLMKEAGVGWVRMDFLWEDIEPAKGKFAFAKYDRVVGLLVKNNIHILGIFDYSAQWASGCGKWNCPPQDNGLFVRYAVKLITRYKEKIRHWEVWNEPDSGVYWSRQDGLRSYCRLLKDVYIAAKKADPDCKILNGGLAQGSVGVKQLYDNGARGYFDILNIHFFENPRHGEGVIKGVVSCPRLAHKVMERNGDGHKKIWITEIGCPGVRRGTQADNWWLGENPDEKEQGAWVKKVYTALLKDKNVEKIFWAFFRDCSGHWGTGVDYFGLVRWGYTRKPSFRAYKECVDEWKKGRKVKKIGAEGGS